MMQLPKSTTKDSFFGQYDLKMGTLFKRASTPQSLIKFEDSQLEAMPLFVPKIEKKVTVNDYS
jgi:hypothetical protein